MSEIQKLENEVKAEVTSVENIVTKTAEEAYAGAKAFGVSIADAVKKAVIELTIEEKLVVTSIENAYLKAQLDIQNAQKQFDSIIATLARKYAIDPAKHAFDIVSKAFKAL